MFRRLTTPHGRYFNALRGQPISSVRTPLAATWSGVFAIRPASSAATSTTVLRSNGLALSTDYRWQRRHQGESEAGLVDRRPQPGTVRNRMKPEEERSDSRNAAPKM